MADELDVSTLSVWTLIGPPPELLVSSLSVWTLIGPASPPPPPPPGTFVNAGVRVALGRYAPRAFTAEES